VAGCCEFGDEPSGSCATELVTLHKDMPEPVDRNTAASLIPELAGPESKMRCASGWRWVEIM
jgi:hypothetical protein